MAAYDQLFGWHDIVVAQALLTRSDLQDRQSYLNARTTLVSLLELGVVPIVNENDVVAVDELTGLTFGDNDTLSALVATLIDADVLVILTDTPGLFTKDPAFNPDAELVPYVPQVTPEVQAMAGTTASVRGRGGMQAKLRAAQVATTAGVTVVITSGREPAGLPRVLAGEQLGTVFGSTGSRLESRKRWILSGAGGTGAIAVDGGAEAALISGGKSLLAAGVTNVTGPFNRGDAVDIVSASGQRLGRGISSYSSDDTRAIMGAHSQQINDILGFNFGSEIIHRNNLVLFDSRSSDL
jgi:glutamate 5-kinase